MERITTDDQAILDKLAEALLKGESCGDCMPDSLFEIRRTADSFGANWGCEPPRACSLSCKQLLLHTMHELQKQFDVEW